MKKTLTDSLRLRQTQLAVEINALEKKTEKAPKGILRISECNGYTQYYVRKDSSGKEEYLSVEQINYIKALAQKTCDMKELGIAIKEKKHVDSLLNFLDGRIRVYDRLSPKRRNLVTPFELSDDEYADQWLSEKYEYREFPDNAVEYRTEGGIRVRSKSEALIADMLDRAGVPYKYERPYRMAGGVTVRPDFTVLNKRTREVFIYEHFGMMDDEKYRNVFFSKLRMYARNGFILGANLLASFEGSGPGHEFDSDSIRIMIRECFT